MKSLLTAACIISIACGYIIGKSTSTSPEETQNTSSIQTRYDRPNSLNTPTRNNGDKTLLDSILDGRSISEIPVADLAVLISKLSKNEPDIDTLSLAKQSYQLQLLLANLSVQDLIDIATSINTDYDARKNGSISYVISALSKKDPSLALEWISKQKNKSLLYSMAISAIAQDDPEYASDILKNAMLDGSISANQLSSASNSVGQAMAKLGVDRFLTYLDSLPNQQQPNNIYNAILNIPENERIRFIDQLYQRNQDGRLNGIKMDYIFSIILTEDEASAKEWFKKLPDTEEKNNLKTRSAAYLFVSGDKETAEVWMKEALAASPGKEKEIIKDISIDLRQSYPDGIPFFAELLPEGQEFTAADLKNHVYYSLSNGTDGLIAYANAIKDPNEKALLIANSVKMINDRPYAFKLNTNDLEILSRKIATMGFTDENAALVKSTLEAAKKSNISK